MLQRGGLRCVTVSLRYLRAALDNRVRAAKAGHERNPSRRCVEIGDGGQNLRNAAAGIELIDAHLSAHCESGATFRDAIGSYRHSATRIARGRAPAAPGSTLARARGTVPARYAADVHWTGHLLRAVVAQLLGPEPDFSAIHRAGRFRQTRRCARHRFRPGSFEFMVCISRCYSTS